MIDNYVQCVTVKLVGWPPSISFPRFWVGVRWWFVRQIPEDRCAARAHHERVSFFCTHFQSSQSRVPCPTLPTAKTDTAHYPRDLSATHVLKHFSLWKLLDLH